MKIEVALTVVAFSRSASEEVRERGLMGLREGELSALEMYSGSGTYSTWRARHTQNLDLYHLTCKQQWLLAKSNEWNQWIETRRQLAWSPTIPNDKRKQRAWITIKNSAKKWFTEQIECISFYKRCSYFLRDIFPVLNGFHSYPEDHNISAH